MKRRPLAKVFCTVLKEQAPPDGIPQFPDMQWEIVCQYCGGSGKSNNLDTAFTEFFDHMYFGRDTSAAHVRYIEGPKAKRGPTGGAQ
jgi:hypothetical protein